MNVHNLKSHSEYFWAVWNGQKKFEIRKNDRHFKEGDLVVLQEYSKARSLNDWPFREGPEWQYTGAMIVAQITYLTDYAQSDDYVVFGLKVLQLQTFPHLGKFPLEENGHEKIEEVSPQISR